MKPKQTQINRQKFYSYYKPYKGLFTAVLVSAVGSAALSLLFPLLVRYITKDVLELGVANITGEILRVGALMVGLIILQTLLAVFYDYKGHDMGAKIERDMRQELFTHYQKLPFQFYDNQKIGQLMSRITSDLLDLAEFLHHTPENIVIYGTQLIGSFVILLFINWKLTLIVGAFLPVMAVYSFIFFHKLQKSYSENRRLIGEVNACTEESLSGIRTVKSFTNEKVEINRFLKENTNCYKAKSDIYKKESLHYTVIEFFFTRLITIAIVVIGGIWYANGQLDLANLLVFILYAGYLTGPVPNLAFMIQQVQDGLSGYRRFREIMEVEPEIKDSENARELIITKGRLSFESVCFRYNDGAGRSLSEPLQGSNNELLAHASGASSSLSEQEYVLNNLDLAVEPGETVAIVGHSGVGKTTLCALIPRFYDSLSGRICIDGTDIRDVTLSSLRGQIGFVSQETFLFSGTVLENICYGKPGATKDEAVEAAKKANAHEFINELPDGYDTHIGQRGIKLSGGQRQRLSIARVFLKNPPILIFDEATSALDYESERMVMASLQELAKGRTTFIIAHRLSTVKNADRIVCLSGSGNGRNGNGGTGIAEQGTHEQLCQLNGIYAKLYRLAESSKAL